MNRRRIKNTIFKYIFVTAALIITLLFAGKTINVLILFFGCFVITCSLNPLTDKLSKKFPRNIASAAIITLSIISTGAFLVPVFSVSLQETKRLFYNLPAYINNITDFLNEKTFQGHAVVDYIDINTFSATTIPEILNKSVDFTMGFIELITVIITMSVVIYYMLSEKTLIKKAVTSILPCKYKKRASEIYDAVENKVGGYVCAQILSMATVGILTASGLAVLKIDYSVLLGLIAGICDILPVVGPLAALITGILCAFEKGLFTVIMTILVYLCAQWISNNFVRPVVFGKFMSIHPVMIIFSFLIAAQFESVWLVILSPAIAATVLTVSDELYFKHVKDCSDRIFP